MVARAHVTCFNSPPVQQHRPECLRHYSTSYLVVCFHTTLRSILTNSDLNTTSSGPHYPQCRTALLSIGGEGLLSKAIIIDHVMKTLKRTIQMGPQAFVSHPALRLSFLQPHAVNQLLSPRPRPFRRCFCLMSLCNETGQHTDRHTYTQIKCTLSRFH